VGTIESPLLGPRAQDLTQFIMAHEVYNRGCDSNSVSKSSPCAADDLRKRQSPLQGPRAHTCVACDLHSRYAASLTTILVDFIKLSETNEALFKRAELN